MYPEKDFTYTYWVLYDPLEEDFYMTSKAEVGIIKTGETYFKPLFSTAFQFAERYSYQEAANARKRIMMDTEVFPEVREKLNRLVSRKMKVVYSV